MPPPLGSESYDAVRRFARHVRVNQARLTLELKPPCDIIARSTGSLGSMSGRTLAEDPAVTVPMTTKLGPACRKRKSFTTGGNGGGGERAGSGSMITRPDTVRVRSLCDQGDF